MTFPQGIIGVCIDALIGKPAEPGHRCRAELVHSVQRAEGYESASSSVYPVYASARGLDVQD